MKRNKNFCIIAHIDHGKSTLSDRIIEHCLNLPLSSISNCFLDSMELEKEKGITIKLASIRLSWKDCHLNLIDTPGHIDFSAEVFRSLKVSESAVLLVDLTKGVQAQTISLFKKAKKENLKIIPVLNKIDSPLVTKAQTAQIIETLGKEPFGFKEEEFKYISAKTGQGVKDLLDYLVEVIPDPSAHKYLSKLNIPFIQENKLCALVFEAEYSNQRGTILTIRVFSGKLSVGEEIYLVKAKVKTRVKGIEFLVPKVEKAESISAGEVGRIYLFLAKDLQLESGEHICNYPAPPKDQLELLPETSSMSSFKAMIFSFIAPYEESQRELFINSLSSLKLSDTSFSYNFVKSSALGFGANIGALGPLHLEVLVSRLEKDYRLQLVSGPATIEYKAELKQGGEIWFSSAQDLPERTTVSQYLEPYIQLDLSFPAQCEKEFMGFISTKRSASLLSINRTEKEVETQYFLPLSELNSSLIHALFAITKGYIDYSYSLADYVPLALVKVSICINNLEYPELSFLTERGEASTKARDILLKLKSSLSAQLYELALQAKIDGKIIARETLKAIGKAVAAKCYGGDITRKKKLWEKQSQGKKRLKQESKLKLPHSFFKTLITSHN
ncbi:GTP-binding protein LepA [Mycoplasma wenyonii]|uniref:GTP-binding protein LepA n=1 Tax=Mycoplasma wenyonii TaxID=65123 RepID=A0A328PU14_9MOLU|nr:GTP-binding protein LepA [Mycoplasma wenyonii]